MPKRLPSPDSTHLDATGRSYAQDILKSIELRRALESKLRNIMIRSSLPDADDDVLDDLVYIEDIGLQVMRTILSFTDQVKFLEALASAFASTGKMKNAAFLRRLKGEESKPSKPVITQGETSDTYRAAPPTPPLIPPALPAKSIVARPKPESKALGAVENALLVARSGQRVKNGAAPTQAELVQWLISTTLDQVAELFEGVSLPFGLEGSVRPNGRLTGLRLTVHNQEPRGGYFHLTVDANDAGQIYIRRYGGAYAHDIAQGALHGALGRPVHKFEYGVLMKRYGYWKGGLLKSTVSEWLKMIKFSDLVFVWGVVPEDPYLLMLISGDRVKSIDLVGPDSYALAVNRFSYVRLQPDAHGGVRVVPADQTLKAQFVQEWATDQSLPRGMSAGFVTPDLLAFPVFAAWDMRKPFFRFTAHLWEAVRSVATAFVRSLVVSNHQRITFLPNTSRTVLAQLHEIFPDIPNNVLDAYCRGEASPHISAVIRDRLAGLGRQDLGYPVLRTQFESSERRQRGWHGWFDRMRTRALHR